MKNKDNKKQFIGIRLSEKEMDMLRAEAESTGRTISEVSRKAITFHCMTSYLNKRIQLLLERMSNMSSLTMKDSSEFFSEWKEIDENLNEVTEMLEITHQSSKKLDAKLLLLQKQLGGTLKMLGEKMAK